jgi:uncharacterized protein (DUF305 family)
MKTVSIYFAFGLISAALFVGVGIGYGLSPEYRVNMFTKDSMNLGTADRSFDLRYVNAMIAHHRGAMLLAAQLERNATHPEMKTLAGEILKSEPVSIAELYAWKKAWYGDYRPVRDPIVANLGTSDEKFDQRFLNAIIAHHELGIAMTRDARTKTTRTEVLNNADAVEAFLSGGIVKLSEIRKGWYGI